jgi:tellurite resistance-related uncharacterized protein
MPQRGPQLPEDAVLVRTTAVFDIDTVPAGLLQQHRIADDRWGRLLVHTGSVAFVFEDEPDQPITVAAGDAVVIPPGRLHHLELDGPATFVVEFHRSPAAT